MNVTKLPMDPKSTRFSLDTLPQCYNSAHDVAVGSAGGLGFPASQPKEGRYPTISHLKGKAGKSSSNLGFIKMDLLILQDIHEDGKLKKKLIEGLIDGLRMS